MQHFGVTSIGGARVAPERTLSHRPAPPITTTVRAAREADMHDTLPGVGPVSSDTYHCNRSRL